MTQPVSLEWTFMRLTGIGILCIATIGCAASLAAVPPAQAATPVCIAEGDDSQGLRNVLVPILTLDGADERALRDTLGLPRMAATDILLVQDEATCQRARAEYSQHLGVTLPDARILVFRIGSWYAVEHPDYKSGEYGYLAVFTNSWAFQKALAR
jgi:hypothetical protein